MNATTTVDSSAAAGGGTTVSSVLPASPAHLLPDTAPPVIRNREDHAISRRDIDPDALKVLYRLARNNYIAYLVGGGVRDLLLGRKPKDFDVSTNARPEQIRSLFRNCILIGRRFRLAHVRYGDKIIETSTFRTTPKQDADPSDPEADLFQRDDNLFGSPQEDALRRDFTVNGLFYDIESFSIIDYVGGMEDLAARRIRCIGDPCIRFREDPVRMIRAVRFASRLDFTLDPGVENAIHKHGTELAKAAPARLLEEITRLFAFSSGEKAVRLLHSTGLLGVILPEVADCMDADRSLFWRRLKALDTGDTVLPDATPALIFAVLLQDALKLHLGRDWSLTDTPRFKFDKVHAFLEPLSQRLKFPRKLTDRIVHMYLSLHRFASQANRGKRGSISNFVTQDAFHESLAFAEIILTAEGGSQALLHQWRDLLAERIYGKDDPGGVSHGGGNGQGRVRDRRIMAQPSQSSPSSPSDDKEQSGETPAATASESGELPPARKLSRSARRRRNKRLKRLQGQEERQGADETAGSAEPTLPSGTRAAEAERTTEAAAETQKPAQQSRSRNGKRKPEEAKAQSRPSPAAEAVEDMGTGESLPPLTAAAFWSTPEPEPVAAKEKKKRATRKPKAGSSSAPEKSAKKKAELPSPSEPLPMDRADEADTPMHWLDEI